MERKLGTDGCLRNCTEERQQEGKDDCTWFSSPGSRAGIGDQYSYDNRNHPIGCWSGVLDSPDQLVGQLAAEHGGTNTKGEGVLWLTG